MQVGSKIKVEVINIDTDRNRIGLTARIGQPPRQSQQSDGNRKRQDTKPTKAKPSFNNNPFASL